MNTRSLSGHHVDVVIVADDGRTVEEPLRDDERQLIVQMDKVLRAEP